MLLRRLPRHLQGILHFHQHLHFQLSKIRRIHLQTRHMERQLWAMQPLKFHFLRFR
jgi:hypothetical protein